MHQEAIASAVTMCKKDEVDQNDSNMISDIKAAQLAFSSDAYVDGARISAKRKLWIQRIAIVLIAVVLLFIIIEMATIDPGKRVNPKENRTPSVLDEIMMPKLTIKDLMNEAMIIKQDDPDLIKLIRDEYLVPPSEEPYNLYNPLRPDTSRGQSVIIMKMLSKMKDGFFLEYGVHEGEMMSNTFVFENSYNWSGVLIEENPGKYKLFKTKNRKAYSIQACISSLSFPEKVQVEVHRRTPPNPTDEEIAKEVHEKAEVQCFPFYSILLSLSNPTVHYVSLRGSPALLDILYTIPWQKVDIWTLTVEHRTVPGGAPAIKKYMEANGYVTFTDVPPHLPFILHFDVIFVRNDIHNAIINGKQLGTE